MNKYFAYIIIGFKSQLAFRRDIIMSFIGTAISFLIWVFFWNAIMKDQDNYLRDFKEVTTYVAIVHIVLLVQLNNMRIKWQFSQKVRTGDIILDYLKPQNILLKYFAERLGLVIVIIIFIYIPLLLILMILNNAEPTIIFLGIFSILVSFIFGFLINFLMCLLMIKFVEAGGAWLIFDAFIFFLGGMTIPVWIYPLWLQNIVSILPFQYIYYFPTKIFKESFRIEGFIAENVIGLNWLAILLMLIFFLWYRLRKHIIVQGG